MHVPSLPAQPLYKHLDPVAPYAHIGAVPQAQPVYVTDLQLSWGSVFSIAFRFMVVIVIFQIVFLGIGLAAWLLMAWSISSR